ncbi:MAG TPA: GGDEF domain-containing protein [Terracidiphilus sp.]|nr:GGDEF domain-containing protein [Terracidiphilus sp.]
MGIDLQDGITSAHSRAALLTLLFRETDRAQRTRSPLTLILIAFDPISGFGDSSRQSLLGDVLDRISRLTRSYDLIGRLEDDAIFILLPGCGPSGAAMFAERLKTGVVASPFTIGSASVRLSAYFGITSSIGRSPVIVLREADQALCEARASGPGSVACFSAAVPRNL